MVVTIWFAGDGVHLGGKKKPYIQIQFYGLCTLRCAQWGQISPLFVSLKLMVNSHVKSSMIFEMTFVPHCATQQLIAPPS